MIQERNSTGIKVQTFVVIKILLSGKEEKMAFTTDLKMSTCQLFTWPLSKKIPSVECLDNETKWLSYPSDLHRPSAYHTLFVNVIERECFKQF